MLVVYGALTGRLAPMIAALVRPTDLIPDSGSGMGIAGSGSTPDVPVNPFPQSGVTPLKPPNKEGA